VPISFKSANFPQKVPSFKSAIQNHELLPPPKNYPENAEQQLRHEDGDGVGEQARALVIVQREFALLLLVQQIDGHVQHTVDEQVAHGGGQHHLEVGERLWPEGKGRG
jgi:hypothetical protein